MPHDQCAEDYADGGAACESAYPGYDEIIVPKNLAFYDAAIFLGFARVILAGWTT